MGKSTSKANIQRDRINLWNRFYWLIIVPSRNKKKLFNSELSYLLFHITNYK